MVIFYIEYNIGNMYRVTLQYSYTQGSSHLAYYMVSAFFYLTTKHNSTIKEYT